jgi:hypothetical protein
MSYGRTVPNDDLTTANASKACAPVLSTSQAIRGRFHPKPCPFSVIVAWLTDRHI